MSIGERIISLRKEHNISQAQLATALDLSRQAVSKWENDLSSPDTLNLIKLADVLDTDVEYLATGAHCTRKADSEIITVEKSVEVVVEKIVEKPILKKVYRTKYIRNPMEYILVGGISLMIGILIGILL